VDGLADTLLGGISADLEKAIQGSLVIKPETFTQLQSFIGRGDGSAAETAAMSLLLRAWYRHVLYADPHESYVTSLATADLTEEEMAALRSIILKETPALCGIAESGALWYADQETLTAIETVLLMVGGNDDTAWAFTQFVSYLETGDTIDLPFLDEIRLLWDIREDVRSLCTAGEPFMAFLTGTWGTGKKGENFSLTIAPGQHTALLGESGRGKTTLAYLLTGLYPPEEGTIECSCHVAGNLQGCFVFSGSIRENFLHLHPDLSEEDMQSCLECAQLGSLAASLPQGLDTPLGYDGSRLSGGERNRLLTALALASPAPLLILDEPTAGLDKKTASHLLYALFEKAQEQHKTLLVITHDSNIPDRFTQIISL
jgi:ABC-type lipoprotein export system ATPase subunit